MQVRSLVGEVPHAVRYGQRGEKKIQTKKQGNELNGVGHTLKLHGNVTTKSNVKHAHLSSSSADSTKE